MSRVNGYVYPLHNNEREQQKVHEYFEDTDKMRQLANELDWALRQENGDQEDD